MKYLPLLLFIFPFLFLSFILCLRYTNWGKGFSGELIVSLFLRKLDPKIYKVINNIYISNSKDVVQIDHIVISKFGIFVIDTKNWFQEIKGNVNDNHWWNKVIYQNEKHKLLLKNVLEFNPKMISIIAFSGFTDLEIQGNIKDTYLVNISKLLRIIRSYNKIKLEENEIIAIYNKLLSIKKHKIKNKILHKSIYRY